MSRWTMVTLWSFKVNSNTFLAYYFTWERKLWIAYNWHTIYIKWSTIKDHAVELLRSKFHAWEKEVEFFQWLDLRKITIPTK